MNTMSDNEILELFKQDKEKAFNVLLEKYKEQIYYHIRKILINHQDTDDVVQETLIKIYKNIDNFRGESKIFTWIYRIATNQAISFLNKQRKTYTFTAISYEDKLSTELHADPYFDGDEIQLKLQRAILKLPTKQRLVFNMKYYDDLKYEEIAEILNKSVGSLKASYHHAVKKIERYLEDD